MIGRRPFLLLPMLASCAPPPPPPAVLTLAISCGPDQNPNASGQPTPVAIRLYFLSATSKFEQADVYALMEREKATLADESSGSEEIILRPGEKRELTRQLAKTVSFVGIAVLFRDIDHAKWRASAPVAPSGPTKLALTTTGIVAKLGPAR